MPQFITDGKIIRLGDFRSFYITIKSKGVDKKEDFNVNMIKEASIKFRSGKLIKEALRNVTYKRINE